MLRYKRIRRRVFSDHILPLTKMDAEHAEESKMVGGVQHFVQTPCTHLAFIKSNLEHVAGDDGEKDVRSGKAGRDLEVESIARTGVTRLSYNRHRSRCALRSRSTVVFAMNFACERSYTPSRGFNK